MITESNRAGEFVVSEGNGAISRETITVASGANLAAGTVLGKITASGKYVAHDNALSNGAQNAAAVLYAAVDATGGDKAGVAVARMAEVDGNKLSWKEGISDANKKAAIAALAANQLIVR